MRPSMQPSSQPTNPTSQPTTRPSRQPTELPSSHPTSMPTARPLYIKQIVLHVYNNYIEFQNAFITSVLSVLPKHSTGT